MKTVAVLLDGAFVRFRLYKVLNRYPMAKDILDFAFACLKSQEELFRIYYYDCPPYEQKQVHPISKQAIDFGQTATCRRSRAIHDQLALSDHVAFRRGNLLFKGWTIKQRVTNDIISKGRQIVESDLEADITQKRVDMKIGLDVAWLASKKIVQRLILVTGDSDFVPARRFARQEGVQVVLVTMGHAQVTTELREHCDENRKVSFPVSQFSPSGSNTTP